MNRLDALIAAARTARLNAHAPFSKFLVGAAVETAGGRIITGCNIENATYGLTLCAERVALFKAISEGERAFRALSWSRTPSSRRRRAGPAGRSCGNSAAIWKWCSPT